MSQQTELVSAPEALAAWRTRRRAMVQQVLEPAPHFGPAEWADRHRKLSQGPQKGQAWSNELTPYLVEIMEFVAAPWARRGVVRKSARVGYTEGVILNAFGWTVAMDPCPIAIVQPSDDEAKAFSKENVTPFLDENPIVGGRITELGIRSMESTLTHKEFPGGFLSLLGAVSDKNMRRRSYKRVFVDEVDGMRISAQEGDPLLRFEKRTDDYVDDCGLMLVGSTPTILATSRIEREFQKSDKRFWHVPCPHCRELQVLTWGGRDVPHGVKWDRDVVCKACGVISQSEAEQCEACGGGEFVLQHLPQTAHYVCGACGGRIEEDEKERIVRAGRWIATNPLGEFPGWHIDALISLMPAARWGTLASEFLSAVRDVSDLQSFWNTVLGMPWEEKSEKVEKDVLAARAEEYSDAEGNIVDVPDGVGVLTAFVDVQGSWLELLVRGWGLEEESWDILHQRITGSPDLDLTWALLEGFLTRRYRNVHGVELPILCALVDAGDNTDRVYQWVKPRQSRGVFASMGDKTGDPAHPPIRHPLRPNAQGLRVVTIGTFKAKETLMRRLGLKTPGPKYMHLRAHNGERCNGFDAEYFAQFEAERRVNRRVKGSARVKPMYVKWRERNEAIDLHVGNMAALMASGLGIRENLPTLVEWARQKPEPPAEAAERPVGDDNWATGGGRWGAWR